MVLGYHHFRNPPCISFWRLCGLSQLPHNCAWKTRSHRFSRVCLVGAATALELKTWGYIGPRKTSAYQNHIKRYESTKQVYNTQWFDMILHDFTCWVIWSFQPSEVSNHENNIKSFRKCIHVCIYIYMYTYIYIELYIYIFIYMYSIWIITPSTSGSKKTALGEVILRQDTADHSSPRAQTMRSSGQKPWKLGSWAWDHPSYRLDTTNSFAVRAFALCPNIWTPHFLAINPCCYRSTA